MALLCGQALGQSRKGETFGKPPTTPIEYWDAADYLVRSGQAEQALPYLKKFIAGKPDDATLLKVRDIYGGRSILRLQDDPATRALAEPILEMLAKATRRHATDPARLSQFIGDLSKTREEREYAVERLREAGPFAVPALIRALDRPGIKAEDHALLLDGMGRLDRSATPALLAVLDAAPNKPGLASEVAEVLGRIGDPRATPALTALAVKPGNEVARRAIERITGKPFDAQPKLPARLLADEARRYHTHAIKFPGDAVMLWVWDGEQQTPAPKTLAKGDAETLLGMQLARASLEIDPADRAAQTTLLGLSLEQGIGRAGFGKYPSKDPANTFAAALAAGPTVLGEVLRNAIADGKTDLAAVAATALGKVTDANILGTQGQVNPLVEALSAPGRRARFAAARALVLLDPRKPFAGSSRVVPTLAQFVTSQPTPKALVVDGNLSRGSKLSGMFKALGYDPVLAPTGLEGFRAAADSADVELIVLDHHMIQGEWRLHDTLANLRADARTAGIPVYIVGPLGRQVDLASLTTRFPGVKFLVTPPDAGSLEQQLKIGGRPAAVSREEREGYAREAAALLGLIAGRPGSPFEADLAGVEPALTVALNTPGTSLSASTALGDVGDPNAQRGLADVLIDTGKPAELRLGAAVQLARSIQRFGPLVAADQEAKLLSAFDTEPEPALRNALGSVIGALRPKAASTGLRLRRLTQSTNVNASVISTVPAASFSPEAQPASPKPGDEAQP